MCGVDEVRILLRSLWLEEETAQVTASKLMACADLDIAPFALALEDWRTNVPPAQEALSQLCRPILLKLKTTFPHIISNMFLEWPWEDVNRARTDETFQQQYSTADAKSKYLADAQSCPVCDRPAHEQTWFYFISPPESWMQLFGRAGWMTVCEDCMVQSNFFIETMN